MKKIAYIIAGAALLGLASCTHKQLGEVGMCEKDLLVRYNWDNVYEMARGEFEDPMDNFLSNMYRVNTHVMPLSCEEHIDTTIFNDLWGNMPPDNMDQFKRTLFPARSWKDRAHFTGVYDIFVTAPEDISFMIDTTDMHNSIPTNFEFYPREDLVGLSGGTNTKAAQFRTYVPSLNDLPFGEVIGISQLPRIYYGSKKFVVVTPGMTEHEVAEAEVMMKKFESTFINIRFQNNVTFDEPGQPGGMDCSALMLTGLAQNYDMLNDKPLGGYNYIDTNLWRTNDGYSASANTIGISTETGRCEAVIIGTLEKFVENTPVIYFVYRKADITEEILNCKSGYLDLTLFQEPATLPKNAVPSVYGQDIVWNEIK